MSEWRERLSDLWRRYKQSFPHTPARQVKARPAATPIPIWIDSKAYDALVETTPHALSDAVLRCLKALEATEPRASHDALNVIASGFLRVLKRVKNTGSTTPALTVPLYALFDDPAEAVTELCAPLLGRDMRSLGLFHEVRKQLLHNEARASKTSPHDYEAKRIAANQYKGDIEDVLRLYLKDTPLHEFFHARIPFHIPRKAFNEHGAIFAKAGHGKTQTLRAITAMFLQEEDPPALFIMDSLGSLIEDMDTLEVFATRLKDRLVILDPTDAHPPALNFFKLQSDDLCFYLFKAIDQSFTPRQATMISYLMELMRNVEGATLLDLVSFCEVNYNPFPEALARLSPFARSFFDNQFFVKRPDQLVQQTKNQIAQRIYSLGRMGKFTQMFSAPGNRFDPLACMQEKKIVLINTDARPVELGGLGEASAVFGRLVLAQCLAAARARPKHRRHLALLIVDEAKHYMDAQAALILSDARQYGLGMVLATQFPHQLEEGVRREINTNTSIKMMGPVEYAVASQYARDMFTTPEFIMAMRSQDRSHADWATHVANVTEHAVKLSVQFGTIDAMPKMDAATHKRLRAANMEKYGSGATAVSRTRPPPLPQAPATTATAKGKRAHNSASADEPLLKPGKDWSDE